MIGGPSPPVSPGWPVRPGAALREVAKRGFSLTDGPDHRTVDEAVSGT